MKRPSLRTSALILAAISIFEIAFSSPLFATLGFEYSALMGLALSFICGISEIQATATAAVRRSLGLSLIPLLISVISLPFLPNCAFWDGLMFYIEIAIPSAILGELFGLAFTRLTPKRDVLWFSIFWIVSLVLSLLPGYFYPQLFAYGWQYGFFPGFVWDESLELTNAYLYFRIENLFWIATLLMLPLWVKGRRGRIGLIGGLAVCTILSVFQDKFHVTVSHASLEKELASTLSLGRTTIYYHKGSFTPAELTHLTDDVEWYIHDDAERFHLTDTSRPIHIYVYPSTESLFHFIGTRAASIAKPWLSEVHIAKDNLQSLKHELAHVLLRQIGVWPFYASWSTGLTEGAAMSVEPEYDGIYTLDEHAAKILQMHYATGVKEIMAFTGFAANASTKSYVLAGSFSRYLLKTYGATPFDRVYSSLNFTKEYGKPLDTLEAEWKRWLQPLMVPLDADDSARLRYYYDRVSLIYQPCIRRIGKLERQAADAFQDRRYEDARALYHDAVQEGGGISPMDGEVRSLLKEDRIGASLRVLDTNDDVSILKHIAALYQRKGDVQLILGDSAGADSNYVAAEKVKLSSRYFINAWCYRALANSDVRAEWSTYLRQYYTGFVTVRRDTFIHSLLELHHSDSSFDRATVALQFLQSAYESGYPMDSIVIARGREKLTTEDSLAIAIISRTSARGHRAPINDSICPARYRAAEDEIAEELRAKWAWQARHGRGHETYP